MRYTGETRTSWARPEGPLRKSQRQAFSFQRLRDILAQTMAQKRYKSLRSPINPQTLLLKCQRYPVLRQCSRRQLTELSFVQDQRQAGIAARHRMAHPIAFARVEKQDLVSFSDCLLLSNVPYVNAPIWKHQLRRTRALFRTLMAAASPAVRIPNTHGRGREERVHRKFGHWDIL